MKKLITLFSVLFLTTNLLFAQIINIPADYPTIQEGIDAANYADTVLVAPGTYYENIVIDSINLIIGSLFLTTGDEDYISQTTIDGSNDGRVVLFSNVDEPSLLSGFTIQHGEINGNLQWGAGVAVNWSNNIILSDLNVVSNISEEMGGGIAFYGSTGDIINTSVSLNIATGNTTKYVNGRGGGIMLWGATVNCINCNIVNNEADLGGGVYEQGSSNSFIDCSFIGNSSTSPGAGVCTFYSIVNYEKCNFDNNTGNGAIYADDASITINNCLFTNNDIAIIGIDSIELIISNSTITNNNCILNPIWVHFGSNIYIINSILWNNCDYEIWLQQYNNLHVSNSLIKNGINSVDTSSVGNNIYWYENILSTNPSFIDSSDYHLSDSSPCIGTGNDSIEMNDIWLYSSSYDLDSFPRPSPSGSFPDMGAFENSLGNPVSIFENLVFNNLECILYPNPAKNYFFYLDEAGGLITDIIIYNQFGQIVLHPTGIINKIDISRLGEGLYIVELISGNLIIREKLIIER